MTQTTYNGFPWKIHRNDRGWPRWWQRWLEAWLVVTGKYTFWHAWHDGKYQGSMNYKERYPRIDDPAEAIRFALAMRSPGDSVTFLCCWAEGAWDEIETAYPEYLERVK